MIMKSILIVESENDKFFCERYIKHANTGEISINAEIAPPLCKIDDYECMSGLDKGKLVNALNAIRNRSRKEPITKIGIVIDIDDKTKQERIDLINEAIQDSELTVSNKISDINSFIEAKVDEDISIQIAIYFTNINQKGSLDTLLKGIKTGSSDFADCLHSWRDCIIAKGKAIKDSDFDKFWLSVYMRYDQCSSIEQKQAGRKCNFKSSLDKDIWNFNMNILHPFRDFLLLFSQQ
jgi:hypothetical protein